MSTFRPPLSPSAPGPGARALAQAQASRPAGVEIIQPDQYADRRAEPRTACDDKGALILMPNNALMVCRIIDQSASGARVAFDRMDGVPSEVWLIDTNGHTARHGSPAWSTANRMGLKFDLIQQLTPGGPRPARVPQPVFDAWLKLAGIATAPEAASGDDVLYFD